MFRQFRLPLLRLLPARPPVMHRLLSPLIATINDGVAQLAPCGAAACAHACHKVVSALTLLLACPPPIYYTVCPRSPLIAAINDDVTPLHMRQQRLDCLVHSRPGLYHDDDTPVWGTAHISRNPQLCQR